jgi:hypothetical protein
MNSQKSSPDDADLKDSSGQNAPSRSHRLTWAELMPDFEKEEQLEDPGQASPKQQEDGERTTAIETGTEEKLEDTIVDSFDNVKISDGTANGCS